MLDWRDDHHLVVDGVDFVLAPTGMDARRAEVDAGALLLRKPRWMVEEYAALQRSTAGNVFELGIYEGGSTALLALLLQPRRLVAVDLKPSRTPALDDFIAARGLHDKVHPHYGVNQADRTRLDDLIEAEFESEPLDLVIDDASHLLAETTASFNALFPRLRPGALFVIEDWSWQHGRQRSVEERLRSDPEARETVARRLASDPEARETVARRLASDPEARETFARRLASDPAVGELFARRVATDPEASAALARYLESDTEARETQALPPLPATDSLARLVLELVLTAAYAKEIVAEVMTVRAGWLVVRRGDATLEPATFDIAESYGPLGRALLA